MAFVFKFFGGPLLMGVGLGLIVYFQDYWWCGIIGMIMFLAGLDFTIDAKMELGVEKKMREIQHEEAWREHRLEQAYLGNVDDDE